MSQREPEFSFRFFDPVLLPVFGSIEVLRYIVRDRSNVKVRRQLYSVEVNK